MKIVVTLKPGREFNRREGGVKVNYTDKSPPFKVGQQVYEAFKDAFIVEGDEPAPVKKPAKVSVPHTDDETDEARELREAEERRLAEEQEARIRAETQRQLEQGDAPPIVAALASVGIKVDPVAAAKWTTVEIDRAEGVVQRGGKNQLPAFIIAAKLPE